jgi:two-component system sensor histidine kinase PfeS
LRVHLNSFAQALENVLRNAIATRRYTAWCAERPARRRQLVPGRRRPGAGVADADLERIFEPYLRLDGTQGSGFGLGLSIARRAIELQGGELWASRGAQGLHEPAPAGGKCLES